MSKKKLPCWTIAGEIYTAAEEDPEIAHGFPLRVINLSTGEMSPPMYPTWEELVDGEGLDPSLIGTLECSSSGKGGRKPRSWQ